MVIYNIIYTAPDHKTYLWNGQGFDLLPANDDSKLLYSGKTYTWDEAIEAIIESRAAAHRKFPDDNAPDITKKEISVNHGKAEGGHSHLMSS